MNVVVTILQVVIGLGILNVWLLRFNDDTNWRGGDASNMKEEFQVYGFPAWMAYVVGACKVTLAILLLVGVFVGGLTQWAALGMAFFMAGAVAMHLKVSDPAKKSLPAATLLVLCLVVAFAA